jgi:centromere/kinetochore protein ZW10
MPSTASEEEVCQSVLEFVTDGTFPDSEDVVASEFPIWALPGELQRISQARNQVEVRTKIPHGMQDH